MFETHRVAWCREELRLAAGKTTLLRQMLSSLRVRQQPSVAGEPKIPEGERAYAVGDVHGRLDLLIDLLAKIKNDAEHRCSARTSIVLLGDMIDRGPESRAVVELASSWTEGWADLRAINGNHEAFFLGLMDGRSTSLNQWLQVGGRETLLSYGISADTIVSSRLPDLLEETRSKLPSGHLKWLRELPCSLSCGDYLFVHAGIRPGVPLEDQSEKDLLSIGDAFRRSEQDHGSVIVHGHSISTEVQLRSNRIGVDTGAYQTGRLSAVGLEGSEVWVLEAHSLENG